MTPRKPENKPTARLSNQLVGNIGLYYVCYELSRRGWNALPTSRNAKGVDVVIYNESASRKYTIQVKGLTKHNPAPFGSSLDGMIADFVVICVGVLDEKPQTYIATKEEVMSRMHEGVKDGKRSYWLQPKGYESFKDRWDKIA